VASVEQPETQQLEELAGRLDAVEEAMARIDAGTYALCESCGRALDSALLDADPLARWCPACASAGS
jgi:DnaK suppressor protein